MLYKGRTNDARNRTVCRYFSAGTDAGICGKCLYTAAVYPGTISGSTAESVCQFSTKMR